MPRKLFLLSLPMIWMKPGTLPGYVPKSRGSEDHNLGGRDARPSTSSPGKTPSTYDSIRATVASAGSKPLTGSIRASCGGALEDIVSLTPIGAPRHKITVASLRERKVHHEPITCLTAYDYSSARLVDEAGIDMVLVSDSLAQAMLGHENTLSLTMDEMLHHVKAARRGVRDALLIADMPYGSFHVDAKEAVRNAVRLVKEGGAEVVKLEGGERRADLIRQIVDAEIPVAGHIGLTPQSVNRMSGYKVQGKSLTDIEQLMRDATALDRAGVACIFLEGIPREVADLIASEVSAPTIGIGAGPGCDGQVLVFHDILNL